MTDDVKILLGATSGELAELGIDSSAEPFDAATPMLGWDNRPTWDNFKPGWDNRPTWDNWKRR